LWIPFALHQEMLHHYTTNCVLECRNIKHKDMDMRWLVSELLRPAAEVLGKCAKAGVEHLAAQASGPE
jgi:hypothetical protein